jgi:hypothetical protein
MSNSTKDVFLIVSKESNSTVISSNGNPKIIASGVLADSEHAEPNANNQNLLQLKWKKLPKQTRLIILLCILLILVTVITSTVVFVTKKNSNSSANAYNSSSNSQAPNANPEYLQSFEYGLKTAINASNIGYYALAPGNGSGVSGIHVGLMVGTGKVVFMERYVKTYKSISLTLHILDGIFVGLGL